MPAFMVLTRRRDLPANCRSGSMSKTKGCGRDRALPSAAAHLITREEESMKSSALLAAACVAAFAGISSSRAQDDAAATAGTFPLAAKAGVDSHADRIAPQGAVNQGAFDMTKWKYGHAFDAPANAPIWN